MEELFRKFCCYYNTKDHTITLDELRQEAGKNFKKYQKKAQKYIKTLQKKTAKLGYKTDFESFCNLLEKYINQKDKMNDEDKKEYLRILVSLSKIHEINLREELERYTSYKKKTSDISEKDIFKTFCYYNLQKESKVKDFNKLKEIALNNKIDFNKMQQKALIFIEEIKQLTEKLGFSTQKEDVYKMIDSYNQNKRYMTDKEKAAYLKILLYLSEIYNLDLRSLLLSSKKAKETPDTQDLSNYQDPFTNSELISKMLSQRYQEGNFDIKHLTLSKDKIIKEQNNIDYFKFQSSLTYNLYCIFLDKFNNYAYEDLNTIYTSLLGEEEISLLTKINEDDIYNILKEINNHESIHYICKKYKLTNNLYQFIYLSLTETTNLKENHIGINNRSLFNNDNSQPIYSIYLNGPEYETILLLNEYIKKCVLNNLNYDMSGLCNEKYTILYATKTDLQAKLTILNNIAQEHKDWIDNFGLPLPISSTLNNSFYGLSEVGIYDDKKENCLPYIEYIDSLSEVAYYRTLAKLVISKIPEESATKILNDFIMLNNITLSSTKNPLEAKYNETSFSTIKDLVNQYIPTISNSLSIYMSDNTKKEILIKEFKKSLQYLSNIISNKNKKEYSNIAFNLIS